MPTTHTQNKSVRVSGHLEEKRGIYQMILSWYSLGKRGRKSLSTGLKIKGNKKRAEEMLRLAIQEKEAEIATSPITGDILFADFMEQWLEMRRKDVAKKKLKLTTFSGYQMSVNSAIAPYFRKQGTLLRDLTAEDINEFYDVQLERVKATTVHRYHANISHALQYAVKCGLIPHSMIDMVERPKAEKFKAGFLKQSEVVALFDAVRGDKLELGVILGAYYGLRRSEVVGLRWESINFESNTITIEHTVTATTVDGKRIVIAEDTTKSLFKIFNRVKQKAK